MFQGSIRLEARSDQTLNESSRVDGGNILFNGNSSHLQINTVKFVGSNYLAWFKSILIYIQDKYKEEYLTGEVEIPPKGDPRYRKWKTENATVMGWLLGSMKPEISDHYLFLEIAHQIRDYLSQPYYKVGRTTKVFDLRQMIAQFKYGDKPLAIYYFALQKMWLELEHYTSYRPSCMWDATAYKNHVEEIQVFEFLAGLNSDYEHFRV